MILYNIKTRIHSELQWQIFFPTQTMYLPLEFSWQSSTWLQWKKYFREQVLTINGTCTLRYLLEYSPWVVLNPTQSWSFRLWLPLPVVYLTPKKSNQHYNKIGQETVSWNVDSEHWYRMITYLNKLTIERCTNRKKASQL